MKILKNPNWSISDHILFDEKLKSNNGYCPCSIKKNKDTKCMCTAFKNQVDEGECHCGKYVKIVDSSSLKN